SHRGAKNAARGILEDLGAPRAEGDEGREVPAISRHCWARRQYSSALLATAYCPRPLDDERGRRQLVRSIQQQNPASGRPGRGFCARYARETNAPIRVTTVSSVGSQSRSPFQ